jgi:hypothetical protein
MMDNFLGYLPVLFVGATSILLFTSKKSRWNILALAFQYVAVFWMVLQVWPMGLAVVKLIAGWMAGAILGASLIEEKINIRDTIFEQRFKIVLVAIVWIIIFSITPQIQTWLPIPESLIMGGVILIAVGILQFGITDNPIRVIFGLLTCFSGFEVLYAGVENSVLVAGFLVIITLGIALVGALFVQQAEGEIV